MKKREKPPIPPLFVESWTNIEIYTEGVIVTATVSPFPSAGQGERRDGSKKKMTYPIARMRHLSWPQPPEGGGS